MVRIAESIEADTVGASDVVNCTNKIISPGLSIRIITFGKRS
jgi:hypothetical protein